MTRTPIAVIGTANAAHVARRRNCDGSGRTGPAARASCTISSSVLTCAASKQTLQHTIAAVRRDLHRRLAHLEALGHFTHRLVLELQRLNHLTLPRRERGDRRMNSFDVD